MSILNKLFGFGDEAETDPVVVEERAADAAPQFVVTVTGRTSKAPLVISFKIEAANAKQAVRIAQSILAGGKYDVEPA